MQKEKTKRDDVSIRISRESYHQLKVKAAIKKKTLKDFIRDFAKK